MRRILSVLTFTACVLCTSAASCDTPDDISLHDVARIVGQYETAYADKDIAGMRTLVDKDSPWFKAGFLEYFDRFFRDYEHVRIYHWDDRHVDYLPQGVVLEQNTLIIAYGPVNMKIREALERYILKKKEGTYKIYANIVQEDTDESFEVKNNEAPDDVSIEEGEVSENSVALFRSGYVYSQNGDFQNALRAFRKATDLRPAAGLYRFFTAHMHFALEQKEEGLTALKKALEADPGVKILLNEEE